MSCAYFGSFFTPSKRLIRLYQMVDFQQIKKDPHNDFSSYGSQQALSESQCVDFTDNQILIFGV